MFGHSGEKVESATVAPHPGEFKERPERQDLPSGPSLEVTVTECYQEKNKTAGFLKSKRGYFSKMSFSDDQISVPIGEYKTKAERKQKKYEWSMYRQMFQNKQALRINSIKSFRNL